ncbi:hypothetical protein SeMB42_g05961 [Synchytrium endobioticum]|uniref:Phosphatidic acid phosphatase type 2/haloperoxidase domain-containing protein n=1 Tax=Synchytrium endobioticum TaxID=286115 RepID=A0A507CN07_9FUNG|nr:hypothetical protein SeMB42_g05961 [Synchytrium endobioticum]
MGKGGKKLTDDDCSSGVQQSTPTRAKTSTSAPSYTHIASAAESPLTLQPSDTGTNHQHQPPHCWHPPAKSNSSSGKRPWPWPASYKKRSSVSSSVNRSSTSAGLKRAVRAYLLPRIRAETPYLVRLQTAHACPFNDFFFTYIDVGGVNRHHYGRGLVIILALGVYITGLLKDWLCLPRPPSPPLVRLSASSSAHLEYGFPSTHAANAVSVSLYSLAYLLVYVWPSAQWTVAQWLVQCAGTLVLVGYGVLVPLSRIYTGMHSLTDVVGGCVCGAAIAAAYMAVLDPFEAWLDGGVVVPATLILATVLSLLIYPDPRDACPCYDDAVSFNAVVCGLLLGDWGVRVLGHSYLTPAPFAGSDASCGSWREWSRVAGLRMALGVAAVVAWKAVSKPVFKVLFKTCGAPPESLQSPDGKFKLPRYTADTLARLCSYTGLAFCVSLGVPLLLFKATDLHH